MTWHVQTELLARYARGDIDEVQSFSIEAHLPSCPHCREQLAAFVDGALLSRAWEEIENRLDAPRRGPAEVALMRVGVRGHVARLLVATPASRGSWLLSCALVLACGVWAAGQRDGGVYWFLVLAPLLPLAGVAAAYGPEVDPTYEVGLAAPMRSFGLLLIRALAVLVTTTALVSIASLALPGLHWSAAAWLLPSLALTLTSLVLATRMSAIAACGSLAVAWMLATTAGWRLATAPLDLFGPTAQLACVLVAAAAALVLVRNADSFERRGDLR
jgi:anti-sigma factor RsiW